MKKNVTGLILARLGFILTTFFIFVYIKHQLLTYEQLYQQYAAMLQQISQTVIDNTANIAQLSTIVDTFGNITQYYSLIIFVGTPVALFLAFLLFEGVYWKFFTPGISWKTFYTRFSVISLIGWAITLGILSLLWNNITLEGYDFSPQLLLFPLITYLVLGFLTLTYPYLYTGIWTSCKQTWKIINEKFLKTFAFTLGNFVIFSIGILSYFFVLTHYEQGITTAGTYTAIIFLLGSILGSVYYQHYFLPYFSSH